MTPPRSHLPGPSMAECPGTGLGCKLGLAGISRCALFGRCGTDGLSSPTTVLQWLLAGGLEP